MNERAIFMAALDIADPAERSDYLDQACAGNSTLRAQVEQLLQVHAGIGSFMESPAQVPEGGTVDALQTDLHTPAADTPAAEGPGSRIGPYKLLQCLGEGGMGTVFLAEQEEPVKRRVAIKIIKAGMDSAQVIARFEAERQALALMDHPNIARVLDAGTTSRNPSPPAPLPEAERGEPAFSPSPLRGGGWGEGLFPGRPYFVMELVQGIPITRFCDQEHLTPRERLELLVPVCQAVQHAHQKGIIHRDLKPSNVLVALYDGKPVPKVIDFGVAKATAQRLTERTMFTEVGQIVGTLEYMAPEQAELNNLDIDTRADIYSIGALLYELLAGSPPFSASQLRSVAFTEMLRVIRESEPPRPSTRLSSSENLPAIAAKRKLEPAKLTKLVRGDIDWIVMKCLEKERNRRYETANGLALDIQRYLADEPVLASPPSVRYRLGKFLRKQRGPVLALALIALLLVGGVAGTSIGFVRAERQRQIAERNERQALDEKARAEASRQQAMAALLETTDEVVEQLIGSRPVLRSAEREFLARTLQLWQAFATEQGDGERAKWIRAVGTGRVAFMRMKLGQNAEAAAGFQTGIDLYDGLVAEFPTRADYRRQSALYRLNLGNVLQDLGKHSERDAFYRQALAIQRKLIAEFPDRPQYRLELAICLNNLANLLKDHNKHAEAETTYREALRIQQKLTAELATEPRQREELARIHNGLGNLLCDVGKRREGESSIRQALLLLEKLVVKFPDEPEYQHELAQVQVNLGIVLAHLGKPGQAERAYRRALAIKTRLVAEFPAMPHYRMGLATSHQCLASHLANQGKFMEAEASYREALTQWKQLVAELPAMPPLREGLGRTYSEIGKVYTSLGKHPEAVSAFGQALAILEQLAAELPSVPLYRELLAATHNFLGGLNLRQGKLGEAAAAYRRAQAIQEKLVADFPGAPIYRILLGGSQCNLAHLLKNHEQPGRALDWYAKAITNLEGVLAQVKTDATAQLYLRNAHWGKAQALDLLKRHPEALPAWDKAVELSQEASRAELRMGRARSRLLAGQVDLALQEAAELAETGNAPTLYAAAGLFALAAQRRGENAGPPSQEDCARQAVLLLRRAIAKGWKNAERMKKDDDLKMLRQRGDFQKLVAELEKKGP